MTARIVGPMCVFTCPRGQGDAQGRCAAAVLGPDAPWKNIGTDEKPTLAPSYHCVGGCGWHGYIVDGETVATPIVAGAAATITTLHVCDSCGHPEFHSIGLSPAPNGGTDVRFERTVLRRVESAHADR